MKLYMYYLKITRNKEYPLYAWTEDKKLANEFKKFRDMNVLKESVVDISKNEFHETMNTFSDQRITIGYFKTKNPITERYSNIKIPTTWDEQKLVAFAMDSIVIDMKSAIEDIFPEVYNVEIQKALYHLGYFMFYQWLYQNMYIYIPLHHKFDHYVYEDVITDMKECISYDEYEVLMKLRGNTFKKYKDLEDSD